MPKPGIARFVALASEPFRSPCRYNRREMGLLDWLDPTREWPAVSGPAPDVNRMTLQFDSLRFGDPIDSARFLGRPGAFEWHSRIKKDCDLRYAKKGLQLHFREDRLIEIRFVIGTARPLAPDGTPLTREIDKDRIIALFGEPDPGGSDDETLQIFQGNGVASDFDLDESGHLTEWALYPDD